MVYNCNSFPKFSPTVSFTLSWCWGTMTFMIIQFIEWPSVVAKWKTLTMQHLFFLQLFLSLLCFCLSFPLTSFLVVDMIPYIILGICSTSINANLMFCCWPSFLWPFFLWTGNPSLHSRSRDHNSLEIAEDKSFHCMTDADARQWPSSFTMWTWFISYIQCGTLFYAAWNLSCPNLKSKSMFKGFKKNSNDVS